MSPAEINAVSINEIRESGQESIRDYFEQHIQSFYSLGRLYLTNQQQMEELFYQSIVKAQKKLPRFKSYDSFETWITTIFIHMCWELSEDENKQVSAESKSGQSIFQALNQLEKYEKDTLVLTYVKGLSKENAANLLQVSGEKLNEYLFSGIQSLRTELGYGTNFNGCKEYYPHYVAYLERTLERSSKIDLEVHVYHCRECQEDLATFQELMLMMTNIAEKIEEFQVPSDFMENVKARLAEKEKQSLEKNRRRLKITVSVAAVFALFISLEVFTGVFAKFYYSWTEDDLELRAFLQEGLGERLNLVAESEGVKITIKSAIADDFQTLVFYEIEDMNEDNQYLLDYYEGISVRSENAGVNHGSNPRYFNPELHSDLNKESKNVYHGKISLFPIKDDKGTMKLKITKIHKLQQAANYWETESKSGEWDFEIPLNKNPIIEYALDEEIEVEGIPLRIEKLTLAPTTTVLQYSVNQSQAEEVLDLVSFEYLEMNKRKAKGDLYGSFYSEVQEDVNWLTFEAHFDSLFGERAKEFSAQLGLVQLSYADNKNIELDPSVVYPQTVEYAGSTLSIDKVEVGGTTELIIRNNDWENGGYDSLQLHVIGEDGNDAVSMEMESEGIIVDKNGVEYHMNEELPVPYQEIEQPRHIQISQKVRLYNTEEEKYLRPKRLELYGYSVTKYLDEMVKVSLQED